MRTACILAAGRGTRLGAAGRERPKGFIELGGVPIIKRSLERLRRAGVSRVVIVTGHLAPWYDGLGVQLAHNPDYAECGSLRSLACARHLLDDDFLLLESDLVYEQRALDAVLAAPPGDVVLTSGPTGAGDEVWVETRNGRLVAMSKDPTHLGPGPHGELVGISRISQALYRALLDVDADDPHLSYETDGLVGCASRFSISCPQVADLAWGEIDDEHHLARARRIHDEIVRKNA